MDLSAFLDIAKQAAENTAPGQAIKGAMKGAGALTGCTNNLPTNGQEDDYDVIYKEGQQVCYNLNGSKYPVTLLQDMLAGQKSTLGEFANGKRTMLENSWISDMDATCTDNIGPMREEDEEEEEDE